LPPAVTSLLLLVEYSLLSSKELLVMRGASFKIIDLLAGGLIAIIGVYAVWEASGYPFGKLNHMGPGYFPLSLGLLLIVIGLAIVVLEGHAVSQSSLEFPAMRAMLFVSGGIAAFAVLVERLGLVPAVVAAVAISALADTRNRLVGVVILAGALSLFCVLVFIEALGIPVRAIGW